MTHGSWIQADGDHVVAPCAMSTMRCAAYRVVGASRVLHSAIHSARHAVLAAPSAMLAADGMSTGGNREERSVHHAVRLAPRATRRESCATHLEHGTQRPGRGAWGHLVCAKRGRGTDMPTTSFIATIIRARQALGWTQRELGDNLGVSLRTATRWEGKRAHMGVNESAILARHVYPKRPDLAEELVAAHGQTLVGLGIAPPPPPPAPPVEPAAVVPPPPPPRAMAARDL